MSDTVIPKKTAKPKKALPKAKKPVTAAETKLVAELIAIEKLAGKLKNDMAKLKERITAKKERIKALKAKRA